MGKVQRSTCMICERKISHGGSAFLETVPYWFDEGDSCMCPDGETEHKPWTTKTGRILTDEDIEALAEEAERGYDVSKLKPSQPES